MRKLALLGLILLGSSCSYFHRHHEIVKASPQGRMAVIARLAGTNPDNSTITVTTDNGDVRVFRVAPSVSLADLPLGEPVILSFEAARGAPVRTLQPANL